MSKNINDIIMNVANKIKDINYVEYVCSMKENSIIFEDKCISAWGPTTLSHGIPAINIFLAEVNEIDPDNEWDKINHEYIKKLGEYIESQGIDNISMFSGVSGIGLAIICSSKNGERYNNFQSILQKEICEVIDIFIDEINSCKYVQMSFYDVIQGLSGILNYTISFNSKDMISVSNKIIECLSRICYNTEYNGIEIPRWYIPRENQFLESEKEKYFNGNFNLGMSHGIAGILTVFCNAYKNTNFTSKNLELNIRKLARFLYKFCINENNEVYWGGRISLNEYETGIITDKDTRDAWCYGTPGVSYALLLAGKILNEKSYIDIAIKAMKESINKERGIYSPTFCHGYSGLAIISKRFFEETGEQVFRDYCINAKLRIASMYDESAPFGFWNIEKNKKLSFIGLLDGAIGTLLTLIELEFSSKTSWKKAFLLE